MTIGPVEFFGPRGGCAGMFAVDFPLGSWQVTVHVGVRRGHRLWWRKDSWWDGPLPMFGLGPMLLICAFWRPE